MLIRHSQFFPPTEIESEEESIGRASIGRLSIEESVGWGSAEEKSTESKEERTEKEDEWENVEAEDSAENGVPGKDKSITTSKLDLPDEPEDDSASSDPVSKKTHKVEDSVEN